MATPGIIYASRIAAIYESYLESGGGPFRIAYVTNPALVGDWNPGAEVVKESVMDLYTTKDFDAALAWLDT